jgi:hypothetical protein
MWHVQIKFSTKSFGIEAAEVAARAIENVVSSLTHADISDIIAGRPEKEVLGALQIISQALAKAKLKALDLSDNALGQKGIIACTSAFAQQASLCPQCIQQTHQYICHQERACQQIPCDFEHVGTEYSRFLSLSVCMHASKSWLACSHSVANAKLRSPPASLHHGTCS